MDNIEQIKSLRAQVAAAQVAYHEGANTLPAATLREMTEQQKKLKRQLSVAICGSALETPCACGAPAEHIHGMVHQSNEEWRKRFEIDTPDGPKTIGLEELRALPTEQRDAAKVLHDGTFEEYEIGCLACPAKAWDEDLEIARMKWVREVAKAEAAKATSAPTS